MRTNPLAASRSHPCWALAWWKGSDHPMVQTRQHGQLQLLDLPLDTHQRLMSQPKNWLETSVEMVPWRRYSYHLLCANLDWDVCNLLFPNSERAPRKSVRNLVAFFVIIRCNFKSGRLRLQPWSCCCTLDLVVNGTTLETITMRFIIHTTVHIVTPKF